VSRMHVQTARFVAVWENLVGADNVRPINVGLALLAAICNSLCNRTAACIIDSVGHISRAGPMFRGVSVTVPNL